MGKCIEKRPELNSTISLDDFQNFYWLKTGKIVRTAGKPIPTSRFDWNNSELYLNTKLTDNYKNTENVRAFMMTQIGPQFRFNIEFKNWAKANAGKNMREAIDEWKRIYLLKKSKAYRSEIAPQFEYNRYIRDFLADNPGMKNKDAIKYWKIKRTKRGNKKYSKQDLNFIFELNVK